MLDIFGSDITFRRNDEREKHAILLLGNVLRSWSKLALSEKEDHTISIGIESVRKRANYKQAESHIMSGYPEIRDLWFDTVVSEGSYNSELSNARSELEKVIREKMSECYPKVPVTGHFVEQVRDSFFMEAFLHVAFDAIYDATSGGKTEVDWETDPMTAETYRGFVISMQVVMFTTLQEYWDFEKWQEFLHSISVDDRTRAQMRSLLKKKENLKDKLRAFTEAMKGLCESIGAGGKLRGECGVVSWYSRI